MMKLTIDQTIVYIDDTSPEARKIALGHKYRLDAKGDLVVLEEKDSIKSDLIVKCKTDKLTLKDVQTFILNYLTQ